MAELVKGITVLGATGSIGVSTLDVLARHPERYRVVALSANTQVERLLEQCLTHGPRLAGMVDSTAAGQLGKQLGEPEFKIWGAQRDLVRDTGTHIARAKNFLYNRHVESCATLSTQRIREIIDRINRVQPNTLRAYVDGAFPSPRHAG